MLAPSPELQMLLNDLNQQLAADDFRTRESARDGLFNLMTVWITSFRTGQLLDLESRCQQETDKRFDEDLAYQQGLIGTGAVLDVEG